MADRGRDQEVNDSAVPGSRADRPVFRLPNQRESRHFRPWLPDLHAAFLPLSVRCGHGIGAFERAVHHTNECAREHGHAQPARADSRTGSTVEDQQYQS